MQVQEIRHEAKPVQNEVQDYMRLDTRIADRCGANGFAQILRSNGREAGLKAAVSRPIMG